jgi:ammonium transporter, Amt family
VNTMLASITGALATMCWLQIKGMKPDPTMLCNGMLAGLVAITAPCAFVSPWAASVIGVVAGVVVVESVFFWERLGIDDPVGAISVHGVNGLWGIVSVGIFANGDYGAGWNGVTKITTGVKGILYGNDGQLWAQLLAACTVTVTGAVISFVLFKLTSLITPIRVSAEVELQGLDIPEVGTKGYPDFAVSDHSGTPVIPAGGAAPVLAGKTAVEHA